ncbi:MAG: hypothetical protein ACMV1B_10745 [Prevotella sp.]
MENNVYVVEPSTVRFDDKYVVFNPVHSELEYEATKENIKRLGQLDPILMLNGLCIDGRHRTRIAEELGEMVRCVDVDGTEEADIILLCNKNVMSGRDYDNSQKAIQALELVNKYKMTAIDASRFMKVDKRLVSYAATIKGYGRQDILDILMEDKKSRVQLDNMERPSRSLELLAKFVKVIDEKDKLIVNDTERIQWNPDAIIKTERGKAWYYENMEAIKMLGETHISMLLSEMANLKFQLLDEA